MSKKSKEKNKKVEFDPNVTKQESPEVVGVFVHECEVLGNRVPKLNLAKHLYQVFHISRNGLPSLPSCCQSKHSGRGHRIPAPEVR